MRMKNRTYSVNWYDSTQNRFEYQRKQSNSTSSALARNETHLVSNETCFVSLKASLERNETRLARRLLLSCTVNCILQRKNITARMNDLCQIET